MSLTNIAPKVEQAGNVKIVTFAGSRIRDDLDHFVPDDLYADHLLLDFRHVQSISSLELAALIHLHKGTQARGGRLTLFNLNAQVFEVFEITRLHGMFQICREQMVPAQV